MAKYRIGFVTNSSSSSYVIAIKDINIDSELLNQLPQFAKNAINAYQKLIKSDAEDIIETKEELDSYFASEYYWGNHGHETIEDKLNHVINDDEYLKDLYIKWLEKINDGCTIAVHRVDYNDESKYEMFRELADEEQIIILECD